MSTFLCKNGVRKEYFLTPTFIIEPVFIYVYRWGVSLSFCIKESLLQKDEGPIMDEAVP